MADPSQEARWDWDVVTDRVTWSEELFRLYGLDSREFRASYLAFVERVHPDDRVRVDRIVTKALRDGQPFEFEHRLVRPDGAVKVLHARGYVERAADGRVFRMYGTTVDITPSQP